MMTLYDRLVTDLEVINRVIILKP